MIKRLAVKFADAFAMPRSAGEQQGGAGRRVRAENRKHVALIVRRQVKETVPCDQTRKSLCQCQRAHVGDEPALAWQAAAAGRNEARRRVDPRDLITLSD